MAETVHKVSVDQMLAKTKRYVENYALFLRHTPKMLRESMMLAYQTAVDDMLKALDASRVEDPVAHKEDPKFCIVDKDGNAM